MYYKSSLSYDIAVRNGERKLINLETLNIPCVAANNEELAGLVKKIINELYLDSTGCDKNHVPYYIETVVYDLLSGSYVGMQGISLRLLDKDAIKLCFAMLKMGSEVLSLCLIGYYIYGTLKAQKNIRDFKGIIEERKFTRSFWCPKCGSKIDIHKRKPCPNCKCELYRNMKRRMN